MRPSFLFAPVLVVLVAFACNEYDAAEEAPAPPSDAGGGTETGPVVPDGGVDAGPAPTGFCATKGDAAVWCEDFDSLTDLTSLVPESSDPLLLAKLSRKTFVSEPQSVGFIIPPDAGSTFTVIHHGMQTDRDVRFELDWQWPTLGPSDGQTLQSMTIKRGPVQAAFGQECGVGDGGPPPCKPFISSCDGASCKLYPIELTSLSSWSHVALQAHFGAKGHVSFEQNGKVVLDTDAPTGEPLAGEPVTVTIGVAVLQGKSAGIELFFDNVFVTLH